MEYRKGRKITYSEGREHFQPEGTDYSYSFPFVENGTATSFDQEGNLEYSIDYKNGIRHGYMIHDFKTGVVVKTLYSEGKKNGLETYTNSKSNTIIEKVYLNDELQSEEAYYTEIVNEKIIKKGLWYSFPIVNGRPHGEKVEYDEQGNEIQSTPYVNGRAHGVGISKANMEEGVGYRKITYENDHWITTETYNVNGRLIRKKYHADNIIILYDDLERPDNVFKFSHENGGSQLMRKVNHEEGLIREVYVTKKDTESSIARVWEVKGVITEQDALADAPSDARIDDKVIFHENMPYAMTDNDRIINLIASFDEAKDEMLPNGEAEEPNPAPRMYGIFSTN